MYKRALITGGAGFIGSHLVEELLRNGYQVRIMDCLDPQVHGIEGTPPDYLPSEAEFVLGDIRERSDLNQALAGVDVVVHLAASVGVGQSMYEMAHYVSTNDLGTAQLLEALAESPIEKLVVASSMSVYGEGLYLTDAGKTCEVQPRSREQLTRGEWNLHDNQGRTLTPAPTPESKKVDLTSIYALSKYVQEKQCLLWGQAYGVPTFALRFFNVYGPRQALSNPYTGVLAIFASRYLSGMRPTIFEDGHQLRDFVHVKDVARACRLALESGASEGGVFNIASGHSLSVRDVAQELAKVLRCEDLEAEVIGKYRVGDIRHCIADISLAREVLGYQPEVSFADGLAELACWLATQSEFDGAGADSAKDELTKRGLLV